MIRNLLAGKIVVQHGRSGKEPLMIVIFSEEAVA
jgi:hypothetical protein